MEQTDQQLKFWALNMWANYIETGNVILSAEDASKQKIKHNVLDANQMKTVIRLRELAAKELQAR